MTFSIFTSMSGKKQLLPLKKVIAPKMMPEPEWSEYSSETSDQEWLPPKKRVLKKPEPEWSAYTTESDSEWVPDRKKTW
jgi:hypothetical protein